MFWVDSGGTAESFLGYFQRFPDEISTTPEISGLFAYLAHVLITNLSVRVAL